MTFQQHRFVASLLDRTLPVPEGITSWTSARPARRFGVYRGNVASALTEALGVRYPVVKRLVGDDFFRAMTREYALANLPDSPVLIRYGGDYPDFIEAFGPAGELTYLADVARFESAHWEAYHAADAEPLPPEAFAALSLEELEEAHFSFLPSVRLTSSRFPIVAIWNTNTHDTAVRPVDLTVGEDALICRPKLEVEIRRLPPSAYVFLSRLQQGETLAMAAQAASEADTRFDLAANLAGLIRSLMVARIDA